MIINKIIFDNYLNMNNIYSTLKVIVNVSLVCNTTLILIMAKKYLILR